MGALFAAWVPATVWAQCLPAAEGCELEASAGDSAFTTIARLDGPYSHDRMAPRAEAVRTDGRFVIDGVLDESSWAAAPPITELWQVTPDEGRPVSESTEVRILYDDDYLYVGAWLWDDERDLQPRMVRRDGALRDSDFFAVLFDSYHDHRVGYRFGTWPGGVQKDQTVIADGGIGDVSWDAVWDLGSSISDDGWFVEMRIPFSQLRYRDEDVLHWGLQLQRRVSGNGELSEFAFSPQSEPGGVARYGHLDGIRGIRQGKRLELLPFVTGRAEYTEVPGSDRVDFLNPFRSGSDFFGNAGLDLKYRLGTAFTLDATVNPDFGQVEQDPAVINLTAFETRFDEKRPFFVEGADIFQFGDLGGRVGGSEAQLLYSRRIGRPPQGSTPQEATYRDIPGSTAILGALKLSGRTTGGWSMAVLDAVTDRVQAPWVDAVGLRHEAEVEPTSNYFAARARRDLRQGTASFGLLATAVNRAVGTGALASRLRSSAYSLGADGRLEWSGQAWKLAGKLSASRVTGSAEAIARTQRSSARYMDRPDAEHLNYDPGSTALSGFYGKLDLIKQSGSWQGRIGATALSPGFEVNDLGFQSWADRIETASSFGYRQPRVGPRLRSLSVTAEGRRTLNFGGDVVDAAAGLSLNAVHSSFNGVNANLTREFDVWDDRLTRGGPLTRRPAGYSGSIGFRTDQRRDWQVRWGFGFSEDDGGGWSRRVDLNFWLRLLERIELNLGPRITRTHTAAQYVKTIPDPSATATFGERHVFAPLDQTTLGIETELMVAFNPKLTLEVYAQPFVSSGDYGALMELARPRSFEFLRYGRDRGSLTGDGGGFRVEPDGTDARVFSVPPLDFDFRSLIGNAVLRWEWRTGSTLFLVWQQTRSERLVGRATEHSDLGRFELGPDTRALFGLKPDNVFMLKATYWLNP